MSESSTKPRCELPFSKIVQAAADARRDLRAGASLNTVIRPTLQKLQAESRPAAQAIIYESVRKTALTHELLSTLCSRTPTPAVLSLLEAAFAAFFLGRYADFTIVSETVNAAKAHPATRTASGFINAILRRYLREKENLLANAEQHPEVRFNAPRWWIERIRAAWPSDAERILTLGTAHPPMTLRVNCRKTDPETYLQTLRNAGINAKKTGPEAVTLLNPLPVEHIPGFTEGLSSVQDAGTQLAAHLLPISTGDRVLDACAAPGGKTAHILEMRDCEMTALEIDPARTEKIRETLSRLSLCADVRTADAADTASWWDGKLFDAILLDAPCTASGVVRRQPDTPWLRRAVDIKNLAKEQRTLLHALWPLLKKGGHMLYATCSIFPEEGSIQMERFKAEMPDAMLIPFPGAPEGILTLLPEENEEFESSSQKPAVHDGFFYALLQKRK